MNANPFTLGHLYLTERASAENDTVHLFMVSEDASLIPFKVRRRLVTEGTSHLDNIIYHDSGPYIISSATFPSYFQKDMDSVIESHANWTWSSSRKSPMPWALAGAMWERNPTAG